MSNNKRKSLSEIFFCRWKFVIGAAIVISAMGVDKKAARAIDEYLKGK
jgi:NADPH-dependent glutamate synthase beta subunit-like oxidoreductase